MRNFSRRKKRRHQCHLPKPIKVKGTQKTRTILLKQKQKKTLKNIYGVQKNQNTYICYAHYPYHYTTTREGKLNQSHNITFIEIKTNAFEHMLFQKYTKEEPTIKHVINITHLQQLLHT